MLFESRACGERFRWRMLGALTIGATFLLVTTARADEEARPTAPRLHGSLGLAHAVGSPQDRELGFGALLSGGMSTSISSVLSVKGTVRLLVLADGSPPLQPHVTDRSSGVAIMALGGLHAQSTSSGLWGELGLGIAGSSGARFAFDGHAGWDFPIGRSAPWYAGPTIGYLHVLQPDDSLRPEDAHILTVGVHVAYGRAPGPCRDSDGDGVCNDVDACPDEVGRHTNDPATDGCARRDRDKDSVWDDEDACPTKPGVRTEDPKTNGCPPVDEDKDGVPDSDDACPERPGQRSSDATSNGCPPPDRDNDGIPDADDACPDVPGPRTTDAKTNGCPPPKESVSVLGDRLVLADKITFENDSPRVRRQSWSVVEKVAKFLNATPDVLEVDIEGHADRVGTEEHNLTLSRDRAAAVQRLLVKYGVDPKRINARGFGESRPISQTRSQSELSQDRRVEFWVVRARRAPDAPAPAKGSTKP